MAKTFRGGIYPKENKTLSENTSIRPALPPKTAILPLLQSSGAPAEPVVQVGDIVKIGQFLAGCEKFISTALHSPICGRVSAIEDRLHPAGVKIASIIIENSGENTFHPGLQPYPPLEKLSQTEIQKIVREAGIVGLGGAAFPTHVKLSPPPNTSIEHVILNGAECEPYLTCDHRLMIEQPENIILGLLAILKATGAKNGIIAVEANTPAAIAALQKALQHTGRPNLRLEVLKTKFPQGAEKQIIWAILKKEVPSGCLPAAVHCLVQNVGTAAALAHTLKTGRPLIERVVTVTGSAIRRPANLLVKIGTPFAELIEQCGGLKEAPAKIIMGGPLTGITVPSSEVPVIKATNGILALSQSEIDAQPVSPCLRCARCVDACPQFLLPNFLADFAEKEHFAQAKDYGALDCIECGICTYICPAKRNLVQLIKLAKFIICKQS